MYVYLEVNMQPVVETFMWSDTGVQSYKVNTYETYTQELLNVHLWGEVYALLEQKNL